MRAGRWCAASRGTFRSALDEGDYGAAVVFGKSLGSLAAFAVDIEFALLHAKVRVNAVAVSLMSASFFFS
jgi:hypothetical protein